MMGRPQVESGPGLWRNRDFLVFWGGTATSDLGSAITYLALPLTAIQVLGAGPREMGWLVALQQLPVPLLGLFAGVWLDRLPRRPVMMAADSGRAILLAAVPAAALLGRLSLELLYVLAFGIGALTVVFDLGATSYLPSLVARRHLLEGNAKLQITGYVAAVAGRGGGGLLVQLLTPPLALLVDAATFVFSAFSLGRIRRREPARTPGVGRARVWREIGEGLRFTFREPRIASMTIVSTLGACGGSIQQTVFFLFLANQLGLPTVWIGIVTGSSALGAWLGAQFAAPAGARAGPGPCMIVSSFLGAAGATLLPLAAFGFFPAIPTLTAGQGLMGMGLALYSVNQISLRQVLTPDALLGRVNATRRVLVFGSIPLGAIVGGALGDAIGLRATLAAGASLSFLAAVIALASPLRGATVLPDAPPPS